jgi:uncharacterized protein YdaT
MNFKVRAKTLRRKMSECAFDQSGDGPSEEDLIAKALEKAYDDGRQYVYDKIEDLLRRNAEKAKEANENSKEDLNDYSRGM